MKHFLLWRLRCVAQQRRQMLKYACLVMHSLQIQGCMQAQNEVAVLALLDHPNVVKYYECFAEQGTRVKIVMELCEARSAPSRVCSHPQ